MTIKLVTPPDGEVVTMGPIRTRILEIMSRYATEPYRPPQ